MTRITYRLGIIFFTAAGLTCLSSAAIAQWAWKDDNGHLVFSDRGPPVSVKPGDIVRQPGRTSAELASPTYNDAAKADPKAAMSKTPAAPVQKSLAERDLEARKMEKNRADAERKADQDKTAQAQKAQECERAKGYQRALDDGQRITSTDAAGNREFLDDDKRAAESDRIRKLIQSSCS